MSGDGSRASVVRAGLGPTLPALLRARFGISPRTTAIGSVVLALVLVAGGYALTRVVGPTQIVHRGDPVFNVLTTPDTVKRAQPQPGELLRLERRRRPVFAAFTVTKVPLEPYRGDVARGLLPAFAERHIRALEAELDGFDLREEARARVNGAPGYQVAYVFGSGRRRTYSRDVLVVEEEVGVRSALLLRLRQEVDGGFDRRDAKLTAPVRKAFRSFRFGTERK